MRTIKQLTEDPNLSLGIAAIRAEKSLRAFIPLVWHVIEPISRPFVDGWACGAICEHLEAVTSGEIKRLLINVPPGCMKSLTTEVLWPAWEWGPKDLPHHRYVSASYSEALTVRDNRRTRHIINSEIYQQCWGKRFRLLEEQNAKIRFDTDKTGFKIATSVGGLGTGERGDRFIIDDPHNIKETESDAKRSSVLQWFSEVVPTRLNDPDKSAIVVIMQRVHSRDVSGLILSKELGYEWLCLPMEYEKDHRCFTKVKPRHFSPSLEKVTWMQREAEAIPKWYTPEELEKEETLPEGYEPKWQELYTQDPRSTEGELLWPERFSQDHIEMELKPPLRAWGGSYAEAGQLQQRPAPRGGGMFKREDFQFVDQLPEGGRWIRAYDLAATKDAGAYTVGVKIALINRSVYISDVQRFRLGPGAVLERIKAIADMDGRIVTIDIPQDPGQAGKSQRQDFAKQLHGYRVVSSPETGSKPDRAKPLAAQNELHNLYLLRASWNDAFISEACLFPNGQFLDQIDAASRGYARLVAKRPQQIGVPPEIIGAY